MQPMLWGLVPPWHRGPAPTTHGLSTNNCRVEGVAASKLYSPSLASRCRHQSRLSTISASSPLLQYRRCVVVCEGFYEWCKQETGAKQPYLVTRPLAEGE